MRRLILMSVMLALAFPVRGAADVRRYLIYEEFIKKVEAGEVKSVTIETVGSIKGVLTDQGKEYEFETYRSFNAADDPLLKRLLRQHNVGVTTEIRDYTGMLWDMFEISICWIPPVVLVVLVIILVLVICLIRRIRKLHEALDASRGSEADQA